MAFDFSQFESQAPKADLTYLNDLDDLPDLPEQTLPDIAVPEIAEPMLVQSPEIELPEVQLEQVEVTPTDVAPSVTEAPVEAPRPVPVEADAWDVVKAAFNQENIVVNAIDWFTEEDFEPVEGYVVTDAELKGYERYSDDLVESGSPEETAHIKAKIDKELENKRILDEAGWGGIGAQVAAAIADPTIVIGGVIAKGIQGTTRLARAGIAAGIGLVEGAVVETGLQANQITRTTEESVANVTINAVAAGALQPILEVGGEFIKKKLARDIDDLIAGRPDEDFTKLVDGLFGEIGKGENLLGRGAGKLSRNVSPSVRLAASQSPVTRKTGALLAEDNLLRLGDAGDASMITQSAAETSIKARVARDSAMFAKTVNTGLRKYERELVDLGLDRSEKDLFNERVMEYIYKARVDKDDTYVPMTSVKEVGDALFKQIDDYGSEFAEAQITSTTRVFREQLETANKTIGDIDSELSLLAGKADTDRVTVGGIELSVGTRRQALESSKAVAQREASEATNNIDVNAMGIREMYKDFVPIQWNPLSIRSNRSGLRSLVRGKVETGMYGIHNRIQSSGIRNIDMLESQYLEIIEEFIDEADPATRRLLGTMDKEDVARLFDTDDFDKGMDNFINDYVDSISDNLEDSGLGMSMRTSAREVVRILGLSMEEMTPFVRTDVRDAMKSYANYVIPRVEIANRFGDWELSTPINDIKEHYRNILKNVDPDSKEYVRISKERDYDIKNVESMRDVLLGRYAGMQGAVTKGQEAARIGRTFTQGAFLGGVLFSSLPDLAMPIIQNGFRAVFETMGKGSIQNLQRVLQVPTAKLRNKAEKEALQAMGIALDRTISRRLDNLMGVDNYRTNNIKYLSSSADWVRDNFGMLTFMDMWTDVMQEYAAKVSMNRVAKIAKRVANNKKLSIDDQLYMGKLRLTKQDLRDVLEQQNTFGSMEVSGKFGNTIYETQRWENRVLADKVRDAIIKDVDSTIINPSAGDKPFWLNTEVGKSLAQFKSFTAAAQSRVAFNAMQRMRRSDYVATVSMVGGMFSFAAIDSFSDWVKHHINQIGKSEDSIEEFDTSVDKLFLTNLNALPVLGHTSQILPLLGIGDSKYASLQNTLMPPMVGYAGTGFAGIKSGAETIKGYVIEGDDLDFTKSVRAFSRMVPFQSALGFKQVFNSIGAIGTGEAPALPSDWNLELTE